MSSVKSHWFSNRLWRSGIGSILGADRCMTRPSTEKQREGIRRVGMEVNKHCYGCRKHLKRNGSVNYVQTCFCCSICKILLWREDRIYLVAGRTMTYFKEHGNYDESHICCNNLIHCRNYPIDKMINLDPRRSSKKNKERWKKCLHQLFVLIWSYY